MIGILTLFLNKKEYFDKVFDVCQKERPQLLQYYVQRLCASWSQSPQLMLPFIPAAIPRLLLYRESCPDDHNLANWQAQALREEDVSQSTRLLVLQFIESILTSAIPVPTGGSSSDIHSPVKEAMCELVMILLQRNLSPELAKAAILGSEKYWIKLRLWQVAIVPYFVHNRVRKHD